MTDAAVVGRLLRAYHLRGVAAAAVRRLSGSVHGEAVSYLIAPPDRPALVLRACRADAPVPVQFRGPFSLTPLDWLMARAATLECLAAHEYPAPRLIPTHAGDPVGLDGAWLTLATSYVEGAVLRPTLGELRLLGESLGRLHELAVPVAGLGREGGAGAGGGGPWPGGGAPGPGGGVPGPGHAAWHPAAAVPATLHRLDRVAALVPDDWRSLHGQFRDAVLAIQQRLEELPLGTVHGDAWPGNAVQAGPFGVSLIGWETGGAGLPVLDLGHCLIECLLDVPQRGVLPSGVLPPDAVPPGAGAAGVGGAGAAGSAGDAASAGAGEAAWLVQPDQGRIAAVASGYSSWRTLWPAERDVLLPAIRFAAAYIGAIHLEQALLDGVRSESMDARWARLRNRIEVSEAVARLASPHLAAGPKPVS